MMHALKASRNGTIVIADDCTRKWPAVSSAWDLLVNRPPKVKGARYVDYSELSWDILPAKTSYNHTGWCAGYARIQA